MRSGESWTGARVSRSGNVPGPREVGGQPHIAVQLAALSKRRRRLPVPAGLGFLLAVAAPILAAAVWASLAGVL